jgi:hypothetical protein
VVNRFTPLTLKHIRHCCSSKDRRVPRPYRVARNLDACELMYVCDTRLKVHAYGVVSRFREMMDRQPGVAHMLKEPALTSQVIAQ